MVREICIFFQHQLSENNSLLIAEHINIYVYGRGVTFRGFSKHGERTRCVESVWRRNNRPEKCVDFD